MKRLVPMSQTIIENQLSVSDKVLSDEASEVIQNKIDCRRKDKGG